jgi:hypothetical protein
MERVPVHALVTDPGEGSGLAAGPLVVRGAAWSGSGAVTGIEVRIDDGRWHDAAVTERTGRYGRTLWQYDWAAEPGRHTIAVRARDASGAVQPSEPVWNRRGYANNSVHRVTVTVEEVT